MQNQVNTDDLIKIIGLKEIEIYALKQRIEALLLQQKGHNNSDAKP